MYNNIKYIKVHKNIRRILTKQVRLSVIDSNGSCFRAAVIREAIIEQQNGK